MKKHYIDIKFIDTSSWSPQFHLSSGGTRAKRVLENENGKKYFFKHSEYKPSINGQPEKDYKYEFFNEIIAYHLGRSLDLPVLRYDIAIYQNQIGCLSPLMINLEKEEQLVEFGRYMTALNHEFDPNHNTGRKQYTFQLLEKSINLFEQTDHLSFIFQVLIFDAIIGNVDRHQENWAYITIPSIMQKAISEFNESVTDNQKPKWIKSWVKFIFKTENEIEIKKNSELLKLFVTKIKSTAPIYDSGSSLGRELTKEKVSAFLNDPERLIKYINNGKAELHWNGNKLSHFELLKQLLKSEWSLELKHNAQICHKFEEGIVEKIINKINKKIPKEWEGYKIPEERKILISKIVSLRIQKLKQLFSEGV